MATAQAVAGVLGSKPGDKELKNGMTWYGLAAASGHVADVALAVQSVVRAVGAVRVSRYPDALRPFSAMLRAAGMLS